MKKKYEVFDIIILFSFIFLFCLFVSLIFINQKKVITYKNFSGVYCDKDVIVLVISDAELDLFFKNKKLYIDSKSKMFEIENVENKILEKEGDIYNRIYIKTDISHLYKINDVLDISIMDKKINTFNIFKIIWGGDYNKKNR